MHKKLAALIAAVVLMLPAASVYGETDDCLHIFIEGVFETQLARDMLPVINAFRTGDDAWYWNYDDTEKVTCTGLNELYYDYGLEKAAMQRAAELALIFAHDRPDGSDCFTAYLTGGAKGENIARGFTGTQSVFDAWAEENESYDGQGHRRNMLGYSYGYVGIACFRMGNLFFWVQEFCSNGTADMDSSPLPMPVTVNLSKDFAESLSISETKLGVPQNSAFNLSEIPVSITTIQGQSATCQIQELTWSSSDSSVASISNDVVTIGSSGTVTLTASAGDLSTQMNVKAIRPVAINPSLSYDKTFNDSGIAHVYLTFDQVADVEQYYVVRKELEGGWTSSVTVDGEGTQEMYIFRDDNVHPIHCTFTIQGIDKDGYKIASAKRYAVIYQESGVLSLPAGIRIMESEAFCGADAYCVIIPDGCTAIGERAFADCPNLCSVRIPSSVTSISDSVFDGCASGLIIETTSGSESEQLAADLGYTLFLTD